MKEYQTINEVSGPLVFAEIDEPIGYGEMVEIELSGRGMRRGQVLESTDKFVAIQVFEGTTGIDKKSANMIFAKIKKVVTERKILTILVCHQKENISNLI